MRMVERRRWGKIIACLCLVLLVGLPFAGCRGVPPQIRKWHEAGEIEPLIAALEDENPDVQEEAAEALGKIGDSRALNPLIVALRQGDSAVQEAAAEALGKIGDTRAVKPLNTFIGQEPCEKRGKIYRLVVSKFPEGAIKEPEECRTYTPSRSYTVPCPTPVTNPCY